MALWRGGACRWQDLWRWGLHQRLPSNPTNVSMVMVEQLGLHSMLDISHGRSEALWCGGGGQRRGYWPQEGHLRALYTHANTSELLIKGSGLRTCLATAMAAWWHTIQWHSGGHGAQQSASQDRVWKGTTELTMTCMAQRLERRRRGCACWRRERA